MKRKLYIILRLAFAFALTISSLAFTSVAIADNESEGNPYICLDETLATWDDFDNTQCYEVIQYYDDGCLVIYGEGKPDIVDLSRQLSYIEVAINNPDLIIDNDERGVICCDYMRLNVMQYELHGYTPPLPAGCVYYRYQRQYCMSCGATHTLHQIGGPYYHTHPK